MTSPLLDMRLDFPQTSLWTESASALQLIEAIGWGVTGAVPDLARVADALAADPQRLAERLAHLASTYPTASEHQLGFLLAEDLLLDSAAALQPTFEKRSGREGRISFPTDPLRYRDADALVEQAAEIGALAANTMAAIPATDRGLGAIEEASVLGVSVNAFGCTSLSQLLAAAEAIEKGLARRENLGHETRRMAPVVTLHLGALDETLAAQAERAGLILEPGICQYAGLAVFKEAYRLFAERAYTSRLLAGDIRHGLQMTELLGGDVVLAPSFAWQKRLAGAQPILRDRIDAPIKAARVAELAEALPDFEAAMRPDGVAPADFEGFEACRRVLRHQHAAAAELTRIVVNGLYPAP